MNKEFKQFVKENERIRKELDEILQHEFSTLDDDYSDIWEKISNLIGNEINQEKECNI